MIIYNTLDGIKRYREHPAINQSLLKDVFEGRKRDKWDSISILLGSYLDAKVTLEEADDTFVFFEGKRPSEAVTLLCDKLKWSLGEWKPLSECELEVFLADKDFYANLQPEGQAKNFVSKANDWWEFLRDSEDKFILTQSEKDAQDLLATKVSWFINGILPNEEHTLYYQKELYWSYMGIECKGLADMVIETNNEIIEIDLKFTTAKTLSSWAFVARDLNYPFQKSFYREGLRDEGKKISQFWLVVGPNFINLVPFTRKMFDFGLNGYFEHTKTLTGTQNTMRISKRKYGVIEAINFYKNPVREEPQFLTQDQAENLLYGEQ